LEVQEALLLLLLLIIFKAGMLKLLKSKDDSDAINDEILLVFKRVLILITFQLWFYRDDGEDW
jgi:hypothetical protein